MKKILIATTRPVTRTGVKDEITIAHAKTTRTATHGLVDVINAWMDCQVISVVTMVTARTTSVTRISVARAILVTSAEKTMTVTTSIASAICVLLTPHPLRQDPQMMAWYEQLCLVPILLLLLHVSIF